MTRLLFAHLITLQSRYGRSWVSHNVNSTCCLRQVSRSILDFSVRFFVHSSTLAIPPAPLCTAMHRDAPRCTAIHRYAPLSIDCSLQVSQTLSRVRTLRTPYWALSGLLSAASGEGLCRQHTPHELLGGAAWRVSLSGGLFLICCMRLPFIVHTDPFLVWHRSFLTLRLAMCLYTN